MIHLPAISVVGRVANRIKVVESKRHRHYTMVLMYLSNDTSARLLPVMAFDVVCWRLSRQCHRGDLISLTAHLDAHQYGKSFSPVIVATDFKFLELPAIRKLYANDWSAIKQLFPFVPTNYRRTPVKHRAKSPAPTNHQAAPDSTATVVKSAAPVTSSASPTPVKATNQASTATPPHSWLDDMNRLTSFEFPSLK